MNFYEIYSPTKNSTFCKEDAVSSVELNNGLLYVIPEINGNYLKIDWPMSEEFLDGSVLDSMRGVNNEAFIPLQTPISAVKVG